MERKALPPKTSPQAPRGASWKADKKLANWQADKLTNLQADRLTSWQIVKQPDWQDDKKIGWQDDKMTRWLDDMTWREGMTEWHDDIAAWWHDDGYRKLPRVTKCSQQLLNLQRIAIGPKCCQWLPKVIYVAKKIKVCKSCKKLQANAKNCQKMPKMK